MPQIKEGWANALEPGIREYVLLGEARVPSLIETMFDVIGSMKSAEHFGSIGSVSPDAWDQFKKTKVPAKVSFDEGYKKTFTHETFMVELDIEAELIEDAQYPQIIDAAGQLGESFGLKRETDGAGVFNNAFTDSALYHGADGKPLCSDSHPNGPTVSGTQDNNDTLTLTKDNVKTTRERMMQFKDDRGNLVAVVPDTLIVPVGLEDAALVIANSILDPTSGNNAINPQSGRFRVITHRYLTDTNAWFMADSMRMKRDLKWINRVPFSTRLKAGDTSVFATYISRARYSYGFRDWRWIYGNNPA